jgi:DNA primase
MSSQIDQVKEANSIVEIVGERISIHKAGSYYRALCPFHHETSPSFFIDENLGRFKCFGCGESGDVFNFLEKYDNLTFYESLKYLAKRVGIELKGYSKNSQDEKREVLLEILDLASHYYHYLLTEHSLAGEASDYLKNRGINNQSIKLFSLGFAPDLWDGLIGFLHKKKKYELDDLVESGLVIKNAKGRYYDRFRGRVMFPLRSHLGRVVGFSGRLLKESKKEGKYINTNETVLYHKSKMLFGYHELLSEIRKKKEILIVEGEFDVISSAQIGINNIVAIKGSAFTNEQAKILKRIVNKIILCLDNDEAGLEATTRAIKILQLLDFEIRVLVFNQGKDPDELARNNPNLYREKIKQSLALYDFLINLAVKKFGLKSIEAKKEIVGFLSVWFEGISNAVEYDFYIEKLAGVLKVKVESLKIDLKQGNLKKQTKKKSKESNKEEKKELTAREKLEVYALVLTLNCEDDFVRKVSKELVEFNWNNLKIKLVISSLEKYLTKKSFKLKEFNLSLSEDLQIFLGEISIKKDFLMVFEKEGFNPQDDWKKIMKRLKKEEINRKVRELEQKISESELNEKSDLNDLLKKMQVLQKEKNKILA